VNAYKNGAKPQGKAVKKTLYILNGPNLNLLGTREPEIYGSETLADVERRCAARAKSHGYDITFQQSNHEGQLVDWIQEARRKALGIIINAGAFTHTSVALHDALKAADVPAIEVHLSNVFRREAFRHHSHLSPVVNGVILGFGVTSYELAVDGLVELLKGK
jgi:3-dehydroquinate dehydratase-2